MVDLGHLERQIKALAARAAAEGYSLDLHGDEDGLPVPCLVRTIYAAQTESTEH